MSSGSSSGSSGDVDISTGDGVEAGSVRLQAGFGSSRSGGVIISSPLASDLQQSGSTISISSGGDIIQ